MHRGAAASLALAGISMLVLAIGLARTGTELDQIRLERTDLQTEVDVLHRQLDNLSTQRHSLLGQVDEHVRAIEQLKHEMERVRAAKLQSADAKRIADEQSQNAAN